MIFTTYLKSSLVSATEHMMDFLIIKNFFGEIFIFLFKVAGKRYFNSLGII